MITRRGRWLRSCGGTAGHTGGPCPGPQTLACLGGSQCPCFSSPSPNRECAARTGVATIFPPSVAEGNFRPQPRWPRGPAPWILTRWAPQSPGGSPAPDPGRPRFPLTWPATGQARSPRESYGPPRRGPCPFCAAAVILPGRRLPRLSRVLLPRWRERDAPEADGARFPLWGGGSRTSRSGHPAQTEQRPQQLHPTAEPQLRLCKVLSPTMITTGFTKFTGS